MKQGYRTQPVCRIHKEIILCIGALLLFFLMFASGMLDTQKVWPDVPLDIDGGKRAFSLEGGDCYGTVSGGPYYDLPAGRYRIRWQITGDGENVIRLSSSNDARITPLEIRVIPERWEDEAYFEIEDPVHSFSINIGFEEGTRMEVHNLRLYSPVYRDPMFTAVFILVTVCFLAIMQMNGKLTSDGMRELAVLGIAILLVSYPCLKADSPLAWDTHFHAARIMNLAEALKDGQLPARLGGFSYNGYGAVTSIFYPDLLLYPWALMVLAGASMSYVINTLVIATNILTAACMYLAGRRLLRGREQAVCASLIYLFSLYRLGDLYTRLMVGEMMAMAFLPLFLLGIAEVVMGERKRWPILALAATLVFRSHLLTTVLCALAAVVLCAICGGGILRERRYKELLLASLVTLALNINQIIPMIQMYMDGVTTSVVQFGFADAALTLSELFMTDGYVGMVVLLGATAYLVAPQEKGEFQQLLKILFCAGTLCMLLATEWMPWRHIVLLTRGLVEIFQFPMRFLLIMALCFSLCGGLGFAKLFGHRHMQAAMLILAIGMATTLPVIRQMPPYEGSLEFGQGAKVYMVYPEYQYPGTDVQDTRERSVMTEGGVVLTAYNRSGTSIEVNVEANTDGTLTFPLFGFDGYKAEMNGEQIEWTRGYNNRIRVEIPAGASGSLHIWFAGKMLWRVADAVSLLTAIGLGICWIRQKMRRGRYAEE